MWQVYVFNFVAALLIAGWYLRSVRRLERRMDARLQRFNAWADAEEARINAWADAEEAKYDIARDEIRASLRARMDHATAEMEAGSQAPAWPKQVRTDKSERTVSDAKLGSAESAACDTQVRRPIGTPTSVPTSPDAGSVGPTRRERGGATTCAELMDALVDYLGEELVVERRETLQSHIDGCAKCGAYVATYMHTVKITRALPKCGSLPPEVEARLRKVIEPEPGTEEKPKSG